MLEVTWLRELSGLNYTIYNTDVRLLKTPPVSSSRNSRVERLKEAAWRGLEVM